MGEQGHEVGVNEMATDGFDAFGELLKGESDPALVWPEPKGLPGAARSRLPDVGTWLHVLGLVVGFGVLLTGRIDALMMSVYTFAAVMSLAPRVMVRREEDLLGLPVAVRLRAESLDRSFNRRIWLVSAVGLALSTAIGLGWVSWTHHLFAESPTPYLRSLPLRWGTLSLLAASLGSLAFWQARRERAQASSAQNLESELQLSEGAEGRVLPNPTGVPVVVGTVALALASALGWVVAPDNPPDSPSKVMVIAPTSEDPAAWRGAKDHAAWLKREFKLDAEGLSTDEAWARAKQRFGGAPGELETLVELADLEGVGFVLLHRGALELDPESRSDLVLGRGPADAYEFISVATGDVTLVNSPDPTRNEWIHLDHHPAAFGSGDPELIPRASDRIALARALFNQPHFFLKDFDKPEEPPAFSSRGRSLLRSVIYFDLHPDFWFRAMGDYRLMERALESGRKPQELSAP